MDILAKSNGIPMSVHSINVDNVSSEILNKMLIIPDEKSVKVLKFTSLLHDIGKSTKEFQSKSLHGKKSNNKFRHNEIGWAFLYRYLNVELDILDLILDGVYWHHGISNTLCKFNHIDILESITEEDILTMKSMLIELVGEEYLLSTPRDENDFIGENTPRYYITKDRDNFTEKSIINRTCVISADRIVSKYEDENIDTIDINSIIEKENNFIIDKCPKEFNLTRFNEQCNVANIASSGKTTIIKAPTGFGKTLTGLIYNSLGNKKLLWVCPRNDIAKNMYHEIINLLHILKITNVRVELFITGEIKKSNFNSPKESGFISDIIVTNIDNFLKPTIDSNNSRHLFLINTADVVFDEYHELISESSLFAGFINIMKIRNQRSNCRTLLLSATPPPIHKLWDTISNKTLVLPDEEHHYNAAHNKQYKINVIRELPDISKNSSSLIIFNSISFAQKNKKLYGCENLIHSHFEQIDRDEKIQILLKEFGVNSDKTLNKPNVIGTHILQSSLNISFHKIYDSVLSPESTIQRPGRCNRFGEFDISEITIFKSSDKSEIKMKDILYSRNLSDIWFEYIEKYNGTKLTLNELYVIYNSFSKQYETLILEFIRRKYNESVMTLSDIYPYKYPENLRKTNILTAGSNKLRSNGKEIFVISKYYNSDEWTEPFNETIYDSIAIDFNETGSVRSRILGVMKKLRDTNDQRYEYNSIIDKKDKITLDEIRKEGKKSNTPYIRFDKVYHPEYGLISENLLNNLIN